MVLGYNLLYSYLLTLLLLKSPWKDVNITPSRASLRQNHGRFFVTGKPFRLFFPLAYYNFFKTFDLFQLESVLLFPECVYWQMRQSKNMKYVFGRFSFQLSSLNRYLCETNNTEINWKNCEDWPRDLVSFCI